MKTIRKTRREFLKTTGIGVTALSLPHLLTCEKKAQPPPNIIFIMADDLGYRDLGCYGQNHIQTPNIDKMAREGMRFSQHYAGSPVCAPSRCVLMTGLHSGHALVRGNREADPYGQLQIPDETVTVAELLKQAGYTTGMIGKWGLGVENTPGDPNKQGFDFFYGYYCQVHAHNSFPEYLYRNGQKEKLQNEVVYMDPSHWTRGLGSYATKKVDYSQDLCLQEALHFIESNKNQPFFLYLPFTIPHNNGEAPAGEMNEVPSLEPYSNESWKREDKAYAAMITRLDGYVGKILDQLKAAGIDENTLVMFTSDNGGHINDVFQSNGELRGQKRDLFEGGIRVPLIARWPAKIQTNTVSEHVSAFWDFLPTACELVGTTAPANIDGISLLPTLLGKEQPQHDYLYWEFHWWQPAKQAVRFGDWKAVKLHGDENNESQLMLFNLAEDLAEQHDLAAQHPDIVARAQALMNEAHTHSPHFPFESEKS